jgi:hypothetical protein
MTIEHGRSNGAGRNPSWQEIEKYLVGSADLAGLIDRLSASAPGSAAGPPAILDVLGAHLDDVLDHGLASAPADVLDMLTEHPILLRDLQALIFARGGEHWTRQIDQAAAELSPEYQAMIERTRKKIEDWTGQD